MDSPSEVLRYLLIQLGVGSLPTDSLPWPIFDDNEPDLPDNLITTYDSVGNVVGKSQPDKEIQEFFGVQIRVRAARKRDVYNKAWSIADAMNGVYRASVTVNSNTYCVHSIVRNGSIMRLGKEVPVTKRSLYTVNTIIRVY